jgi:hypothetical protein
MRIKRIFSISVIVIIVTSVFCGCARQKQPGDTVAKINDYEMTLEDFNEEIENSPYTTLKEKSLGQLLDLAIKKQILIQEAQKQGLDRKKSFMKTIERYWEQTLIRELITEKMRQIAKDTPKAEQDKAFDEWAKSLYNKADISINEDILEKMEVQDAGR